MTTKLKNLILTFLTIACLTPSYAWKTDANKDDADDFSTLNVVFIGNSITEGVGVENPATQAPPAVAAAQLARQQGISDVRFFNAGMRGARTTDFLPGARLLNRALAGADSLARLGGAMVFSIMLGTNDSAIYPGPTPRTEPEEFKSNIMATIDALRHRYPGATVVLHRPVWYSENALNGATYMLDGARILQRYATVLADIARENVGRNIYLGDTLAYDHFRENHRLEMVAEQGRAGIFYLHPNRQGSAKLGEYWARGIMKAINAASGRVDAFLKINSGYNGSRPRVDALTFPGSVSPELTYNAAFPHGGVLENPYLAFRVYFDNRQSIDLYAKKHPEAELDLTNFYILPSDTTGQYGRDVLWAGASIAAGSFRGWQNGSPATIDTVATRTQRVEWPDRLIVEDNGWQYNGHTISVRQTYTVSALSPDLEVEIELSGHTPDDVFCTGVQKLATGNQGFADPRGVAASCGSNIPDASRPDATVSVGLAVTVDPANVVGATTDEINYLILLRPDRHGRIRYHISAASPLPTDWLERFR